MGLCNGKYDYFPRNVSPYSFSSRGNVEEDFSDLEKLYEDTRPEVETSTTTLWIKKIDSQQALPTPNGIDNQQVLNGSRKKAILNEKKRRLLSTC